MDENVGPCLSIYNVGHNELLSSARNFINPFIFHKTFIRLLDQLHTFSLMTSNALTGFYPTKFRPMLKHNGLIFINLCQNRCNFQFFEFIGPITILTLSKPA